MHSPWRRFNLALVARIAAIVLLLIALAYPARPVAKNVMNVRVLVEQSGTEDPDTIREGIANEIGQASQLVIRSQVADINDALKQTLWESDPASPGAIIIASAGRWSHSTRATLMHARAAGVDVFWLPSRPGEVLPGLSNMLAPHVARPGQRIGLSVEVELANLRQAEVVLLSNGRPVARRVVESAGEMKFETEVPDGGPLVLGAEIRDGNTGAVIASLQQGSLTNVAAAPSILVVSRRDSVFGNSLREGGWLVSEIRPQEIAGQLDRLSSFAGLILDDIPVSDLPAAAWSQIDKAVRQDALGMLVLGGPHAFGLGAYRDSLLENLLPVISEPPADESPASLIFLIDVSGSMDRQDGAGNRLDMARLATMETAKALRPVDRVGLMTFDVQTQELLAIDARADHAKSIGRAWPESASGGTALMTSLRRALDALEADEAEQKLLVLLTDGFLTDTDLNQLDEMLGSTGVELIAMVVGNGHDTEFSTLSAIAEANQGRAIRVDDVLRLPMLMRSEVESRRPAVVIGRSRPNVTSQATWLPGEMTWPAVDAYLLTRPREDATVHLASARGDVILASASSGAGKVAAVTSGFGGWTGQWLQWNRWPEFATGLTAYLVARDTDQTRISVLQDQPGIATLKVELEDRTLTNVVMATLANPFGETSAIELQPHGPGELSANLELNGEGQYTLALNTGASTTRHRFLVRSNDDWSRNETPVASAWVDDGILALWDPRSLHRSERNNSARAWFSVLSLFVFLSSIVFERAGPVWNYLRSNFNR